MLLESGPSLVIEKLTQSHDLSHFESTNSTLNTWLKRYAWTNQRAETAKTDVAHRAGAQSRLRIYGLPRYYSKSESIRKILVVVWTV